MPAAVNPQPVQPAAGANRSNPDSTPSRSFQGLGKLARNLARFASLLAVLPFLAGYDLLTAFAWLRRPGRPGQPGTEGITVILPYPPGEKSGGSKAILGLLSTLGTRYNVTTVPLYSLPQPGRLQRLLADVIAHALPMPVHCRPFLIAASTVRSRVPETQPLVVEFLSGSLFLYFGRRPRTFLVLRDHEPLVLRLRSEFRNARGFERWLLALKIAVAYCLTARLYGLADRIVALTPEDAEFIRKTFPFVAWRVSDIPVSMVSAHQPAPLREAPRPNDLLFVANFYHRPNTDALLWFLRECAPHLRSAYTLHLCGLDEPLEKVELPRSEVRVVRHGFVEDINASLPGVDIAVAPLISGGGVRMKNLFLASQRKAIVTTPLGNQGVAFIPDVEAVVQSDGPAMAAAIDRLSADPELVARMGDAAFRKIVAEFGHEVTLERYVALLSGG